MKTVTRERKNVKRNDVMVARLKLICTQMWPKDYGHLAPKVQEELNQLVRANRRKQLNQLLDEKWGRVDEQRAALERKAVEKEWRMQQFMDLLDEKFGPVIPAHQPARKPVLRLIQGGLQA